MKMVISIVFCMFTRGYHQSSALHHAFLGKNEDLQSQSPFGGEGTPGTGTAVQERRVVCFTTSSPFLAGSRTEKTPTQVGNFALQLLVISLAVQSRTVDGFMSRRDAKCHSEIRETYDGWAPSSVESCRTASRLMAHGVPFFKLVK